MNEPDATYFDLARSWADERDVAAARGRRIAWIVAILACCVAALEAVSLALMMPLKTAVPIAVLVDRTTGFVQRVDLDQPNALTANEALQRSLVAQYVTAREGYDPIAVGDAYRKVALWSTGEARSGYLDAMAHQSPAARLVRTQREIGLSATVKSISMIAPTTALVRFDVAHVGYDGRLGSPQPYVATLSFRFSGEPMRVEDRLLNPLGFQVRSYRVDAEAAPAPASPAAAGSTATAVAEPVS